MAPASSEGPEGEGGSIPSSGCGSFSCGAHVTCKYLVFFQNAQCNASQPSGRPGSGFWGLGLPEDRGKFTGMFQGLLNMTSPDRGQTRDSFRRKFSFDSQTRLFFERSTIQMKAGQAVERLPIIMPRGHAPRKKIAGVSTATGSRAGALSQGYVLHCTFPTGWLGGSGFSLPPHISRRSNWPGPPSWEARGLGREGAIPRDSSFRLRPGYPQFERSCFPRAPPCPFSSLGLYSTE